LPKLPQFHEVRLFGINKYWSSQINVLIKSAKPKWIKDNYR
jgi:hypothetical protein